MLHTDSFHQLFLRLVLLLFTRKMRIIDYNSAAGGCDRSKYY